MSLPFRLLCLGMTAITGFAASYSFTTVDYPGAQSFGLAGINNQGQIVGIWQNSQLPLPNATGGFMTDLTGTIGPSFEYPGGSLTYPSGIDATGRVLGSFILPDTGTTGAFLRARNGGFTSLTLPSGVTEVAGAAISGRGSIVLSWFDNLYFKTATGYTTVPVPGAGNTANAVNVRGIDDFGNVVGFYYSTSSGVTISFYRDTAGNFQAINYPGALWTEVTGMNNFGQVVGLYYDGTTLHGFVWNRRTNTFSIVDFPGALIGGLSGINDSGVLIGGYADANDIGHAFIATPVR